MKDKIIVKIVGNFNWRTFRNILVQELMKCENQKELENILTLLMGSSSNSKKDLIKWRNKLGIEPFTKEELKQIGKNDGRN